MFAKEHILATLEHVGNTRQGLIGMWLVKCAREERKERESEIVA